MDGVFYPTVTLKRAAAAVVSKDCSGVRAFVRRRTDAQRALFKDRALRPPLPTALNGARCSLASRPARGCSPLGRFARIILPFSNTFGIRYK